MPREKECSGVGTARRSRRVRSERIKNGSAGGGGLVRVPTLPVRHRPVSSTHRLRELRDSGLGRRHDGSPNEAHGALRQVPAGDLF